MSETSWVQRIHHSPMRDLLRGRVTGRLDWRRRVAASGLPETLRETVAGVVRRTRLWRLERAAVADELIAHFHDALAGGVEADRAVANFGDARTAARLIRRAKRRGRPLAWHVWTYVARGLLVLAVIYAFFLANFLLSRPVVGVDYFARLNAPTLSVPEADRAWSLYRRALLDLGIAGPRRDDTMYDPIRAGDDDPATRNIIEATPADTAAWATLTQWLDAHADALALARRAAAKPARGYVIGRGGSGDDPELGWTSATSQSTDLMDGSVLMADLRHVNPLRAMAELFAVDAGYARTQGHSGRVAANIEAILAMAGQRDVPLFINRLVAVGTYMMAFEQIKATLRETPALLSDRQLVALAHRVAAIGNDTAASLLDLSPMRVQFYDLVQRSYSDDGHGDGRLTPAGVEAVLRFSNPQPQWAKIGRPSPVGDAAIGLAVGSAASVASGSRRDVVAEYDRLMDLAAAELARPLREREAGGADGGFRRQIERIRSSPRLSLKYAPLTVALPSLDLASVIAERVLGQRDGVVVALALELHRRRHGSYPATLEALVPALLPQVPLDRIDGRPVRYKLIDGRPVVYSVGVDRDDDAGRPPVGRNGEPDAYGAAQWPTNELIDPPDGDWPLFDGCPVGQAADGDSKSAS